MTNQPKLRWFNCVLVLLVGALFMLWALFFTAPAHEPDTAPPLEDWQVLFGEQHFDTMDVE